MHSSGDPHHIFSHLCANLNQSLLPWQFGLGQLIGHCAEAWVRMQGAYETAGMSCLNRVDRPQLNQMNDRGSVLVVLNGCHSQYKSNSLTLGRREPVPKSVRKNSGGLARRRARRRASNELGLAFG
jgi:hypothetical protein